MADAAISLVANAKFYIGGTITDTTLAGFTSGGRTWTEIKGVVEIGAFGDEREIATIKLIDGARVKKRKGTADAGTLELKVARDPADAGQVLARGAAASKQVFAFKIVANDQPDGGTTPTTHYLAGLVASAKTEMNSADDFIMTAFSIALDAAPVTVEAV